MGSILSAIITVGFLAVAAPAPAISRRPSCEVAVHDPLHLWFDYRRAGNKMVSVYSPHFHHLVSRYHALMKELDRQDIQLNVYLSDVHRVLETLFNQWHTAADPDDFQKRMALTMALDKVDEVYRRHRGDI